MPETPDNYEVVQVIKQEWPNLGGKPGPLIPFPLPIEPLEDGIEAGALFVVEVGRRNKALAIWSDNGDMRFRDVTNPGTDDKGYTLTELLAGTGGVTVSSHRTIPQLIHYIDEGPGPGFVNGTYKTITASNPIFPSKVEWFREDDTLFLEKLITYTGINATSIEWNLYDTDGTTVLETMTDTISYSGVFETGRVRVFS